MPEKTRGVLGICLWLTVLGMACVDTTSTESALAPPSTDRLMTGNSTCVTFQRGAHGLVQDAYIFGHQPDRNWGHAPEASVGVVGRHEQQLLLRFETSTLPPEALITSATLRLWQPQRAPPSPLEVHAISSAWQEDSVSWKSFGGAYVPHAAARLEVPVRPQGALSADLTSLIRNWASNPSLNHGILLRRASGHALLTSSESSLAARRPSLEVCYSLPDKVPQSTSLLLRVLDETGAPLPAAAISVGDTLLPSDGAGYLLLDSLPAGRFVARVKKSGFAPAAVSVDLREGIHAGAQVRLLPLSPSLPFSSETGATLERDGIRVSIPPHAIVDLNGQAVSGPVELTIVPLDPTKGLAALPGPLEGVTATSGEQVPLESFFMAELSLWKEGVPLQLAPGASALVEFLLPESAAIVLRPGDSVPAWWFDLNAGLWREEGAGLVQASQTHPGRLSWAVEVHHFTWWNADAPWGDRSCVKVQVVDSNGLPVANVPVSAVGTSYTGLSRTAYTGADGRACVDIKKGGTADIFVGLPGTPVSAVQSVTGSNEPSVCSLNSTGCTSITLTVTSPPQCIPGASEDCNQYPRDRVEIGRGLCQDAKHQCGVLGQWSECDGLVIPRQENCDPFDEDCDGFINENCGCPLACYTGSQDTDNVGRCRQGVPVCEGGIVTQCNGQVLPGVETCATTDDDDCNGTTECDDALQWAKRYGDQQCQEGWGAATDSDGNIYVTGWLAGSANFGGSSLSSLGGYDVFVAKLNPAGNHIWSQTFSGPGLTVPVDLTVDGAGNVLIPVVFGTSIQVGGQSFSGSSGSETLVVKLTPTGTLAWATQISGPAHQEARGIAVDSAGDVLVTGIHTGGPLTVGSLSVVKRSGPMDAFVLKLDKNTGAPHWAHGYGDTGYAVGFRVAVDGDRNVLVVGGFSNSAIFGSDIWTSAGSYDAFVVKLNPEGTQLWSQPYGDAADQFATDVAVDSSNNVVLTGYFTGTVNFGTPTPLVSAEPTTLDGFLVRLDPNRSHIASIRFGGLGDEEPLALAVDASEGVLISGISTGSPNFGSGQRTSHSALDFFLARYDSAFQPLWNKGYAGAYSDRLYRQDLAFDNSGQAVFAGSFQGTVDLGQGIGTLTSQGCGDALLLKIKDIP
jgi:hypothetical protein